MPRGLEPAVELPFDGRDVDDVLVALGCRQHQRLEPRVEQERGDRVDELRLEQLDRRDLREQEPPRVPLAQIDLLEIGVERAGGEEPVAAGQILGEQRHLRELGRAGHAGQRGRADAVASAALAGWPLPRSCSYSPRSCRTCAGIVRSAAVSLSIMWR